MRFDDIDTSVLEQEVEKLIEEESGEGTSSIKSEESSQKDEEKGKETEEKTPDEGTSSIKSEPEEKSDNERFDKHPRWIKLRQERDAALEKAQRLDEFETKFGGLKPAEIEQIKNSGQTLRKYPELAEKIRTVIDEYKFGTAETKSEISATKEEIAALREQIAFDKYETSVEKLVSEHNVSKDVLPLARELLDNRVVNQKLQMKHLPGAFEKVLADIEIVKKKTLASYVKDKSSRAKVPGSPKDKGKFIAEQSSAGDEESVVNEIAEGMKSLRNDIKE